MSSSEIDRQASEWLVRMDKEVAPLVRAQFDAWYAGDAHHRAAYLRLLETWTRFDRLQALRPPDELRRSERDPRPRRWRSLHRRARFARRWIVSGVAAAALFSCIGYVLHESAPGVRETHEYITGVGGFERVVLSDGSTLEINTDSRLLVDLNRDRRVIQLQQGEATFRVAHDANRPFMVMAGGAVVRAIGTQFNVRRRDDSVEVMVVEGVVAMGSVDALGSHRSAPQPTTPVVSAGKIAIAERTGLRLREVKEEEVLRTLSWQSGMLSFNGQTLSEAAAEFNRYNRRQLIVADPALATLRIGGHFRAANIEKFAQVLEDGFGVHASLDADHIVLHGPSGVRDSR